MANGNMSVNKYTVRLNDGRNVMEIGIDALVDRHSDLLKYYERQIKKARKNASKKSSKEVEA